MVDFSLQQLWINAIAIIPIALIAVLICRCLPCRPATRHLIWVVVLAMLIVPSLLIGFAPRDEPSEEQSSEELASAHDESIDKPIGKPIDKPIVAAPATDSFDESTPTIWQSFAREEELQDEADRAALSESPAIASEPAEKSIRESAPEPAPPAVAEVADWLASLQSARDAVLNIPPLPAAVWLGGTLVLLCFLLIRVARVLRTLRSAADAPEVVLGLVRLAAGELKLERSPRTVMVDARISPMVWCGRQRVLVLPIPLWNQLDEVGRYAILCHELAHLRRRDHWVRWGEMLISLLYWWHPIVWWLRRRIRDDADACCDIWVTHLMPGGRRAYAEALLESRKYLSAAALAGPAVGLGAGGGRTRTFARRLTMVMTQHFTPRLSIRGVALAGTLATIACLVSPITACPPEDAASEAPAAVHIPARSALSVYEVAPASQPARLRRTLEPSAEPGQPIPTLESTFEAHMRGQEQSPPDADSIEQRMRRLEERMNRLMEAVERMMGDRAPGAAPPPSGLNVRGGAPGAPGLPGAASGGSLRITRPSAPTPPVAPMLRSGGVSAGPTTAPDGISGRGSGTSVRSAPQPTPNNGGLIAKRYYLPEGKLSELSELMLRQDVPVLVAPQSDSIEVHATAAQHEVFAAFCKLIHPEGVRVTGSEAASGTLNRAR